jgi:colanic acid/amylovoran biosynthesis glycosyltransferase
MMSECPVVATDHGGTSELIQHGITGLLIPPSDPGRLAEAISSLISQPETRRKMGKAAAVHAYANFSLGKYCERMSTLLWNLIYTVDNRKCEASVPR